MSLNGPPAQRRKNIVAVGLAWLPAQAVQEIVRDAAGTTTISDLQKYEIGEVIFRPLEESQFEALIRIRDDALESPGLQAAAELDKRLEGAHPTLLPVRQFKIVEVDRRILVSLEGAQRLVDRLRSFDPGDSLAVKLQRMIDIVKSSIADPATEVTWETFE